MRGEVAALEWSNSELAREQQVLRLALQELSDAYYNADITDEMMDRVQLMLDATRIEVCACGHLMLDHDNDGCCWLHCREICT